MCALVTGVQTCALPIWRIALASGQREDPMLLLPEQPVSTPRAGVAQWLGILADGLARTPNGSAKLPLLFARAAYWLNDEDWAVRTTLVEALDRNGQREEARSEEHTSELQSLMRISYAVFCLKKKK